MGLAVDTSQFEVIPGYRVDPSAEEGRVFLTPISPEAESNFIGGALSDARVSRQFTWVKAFWFHNEHWRLMWETALKLMAVGKEADAHTVKQQLEPSLGEDEALEYWWEWVNAFNNLRTYQSIRTHAEQVHETWARREILRRCGDLSYHAVKGDYGRLIGEILRLRDVLDDPRVPQQGLNLEEAFSLAQEETEERMAGLGMVHTGIYEIDQKCRLVPNTLVTLAAATSGGKSALAKSIAVQAALEEAYRAEHDPSYVPSIVVYFTFEMLASEQSLRVAAQLGNIDLTAFSRGFREDPHDEADYTSYYAQCSDVNEAMKRLAPYLRFEQQPMTAQEIVDRTVELGRDHKIKLVIIDQTEYVLREGKNETSEYGEMFKLWKVAAHEQRNVWMALHQLTKEVEHRPDHIPTGSDLYWAAAIKQASDYVWFIHRPAQWFSKGTGYDGDPQWFNEGAFLIIEKDRRGAFAGKWATMRYIGDKTTFETWPEGGAEGWSRNAVFLKMRERAKTAANAKTVEVHDGVLA